MMKLLESVFSPERCEKMIKDLQDERRALKWVSYNDLECEYRKHTISQLVDMPPSVQTALAEMHNLCPNGLVPDHNYEKGFLWGGGVHKTMHGGYLAMHKDFNVLPTSYRDPVQLERVANLIVYLNEVNDGRLCLEDGTEVYPKPGLGVLFDPRGTYHGHPWPLRNRTPRYSLAVYFYKQRVVPQEEWRSTQYLPLPFHEDTITLRQKLNARADARLRYRQYWPEDG